MTRIRSVQRTQESTVSVTISLGMSANESSDLDEVLRLADSRLYQAKKAGRNRLVSA